MQKKPLAPTLVRTEAHDGQHELKRSSAKITLEDDTAIRMIARHLRHHCLKVKWPLPKNSNVPLHFSTDDSRPGLARFYCGFCEAELGEVKVKVDAK